MNKPRFLALTSLVLAATALRLAPHPPNFVPIAAIALFGGATFSDRRAALLLPLIAMALSDVVLGFSISTIFVYASFVLITGLGFMLRDRSSLGQIASASVAGAVLFYAVTNLGVWLVGGLYPKTLAGLATCYVAAIPFFWNTLLSDLFYVALLFGIWSLARRRWPVLAAVKAG